MAIARDIDSSPDTNMVNATRKQVLRAALSYFITRLLLLVGLCVICVIGTLTFQVSIALNCFNVLRHRLGYVDAAARQG